MITVAFTVSTRRPRYLRRTLESWAKVRGLSAARLMFFLEPPIRVFAVSDFTQWARTMPAAEVQVLPSNVYLGCSGNTYRAMSLALASDRTDFAVLAEEDTEVADDILEYYFWASQAYHLSPEVLAVCAHCKESSGQAGEVIRAPWFSPIGWGTWADRWDQRLEPGWAGYPDSWDAHVRTAGFRDQPAACCVFPVQSRTYHFGERSTLTPAQANGQPNYFHSTALSGCFSPHYEPQDYREVQVPGAVLY